MKEDQLEDALMMAGAGVGCEEADAAARAIVNKCDMDGDGSLDQAELEAAMAYADTDGDGVIETEEINALAMKQGGDRLHVRSKPQSEAALEETVPNELTTQRAGPSKGVIKRLKREAFLTRVRGRTEAKRAADVEIPSPQPVRLLSRGFVRVVSRMSSLAQASHRSRQVSAADRAAASNSGGGGGGDLVLEQHNAETPAPSEEARSSSGGGDAHPVLQQLHPDNTFRVRQRAAHTLAALLACNEPEQALLQHLQVHSPVCELVALGVDSEERNDALTLQLVFSCIANLAARRVPLIDGSAVGELIARTLTHSSSSDVESQLLGYVLTASNNLSSDVLVLTALEEAGCEPVLHTILQRHESDSTLVHNAKSLQQQLRFFARRKERWGGAHTAQEGGGAWMRAAATTRAVLRLRR